MAKKPEKLSKSRVLYGVSASPGIAVGPAVALEDPRAGVEERALAAAEVEAEVERFQRALAASREELAAVRTATEADLGESQARVFDVQIEVLNDPLAVGRTVDAIRAERRNAGFLFRRHIDEIADRLRDLSDDYFSERSVDLLDVKRRVLRHLAGNVDRRRSRPVGGVLVGREIAPSDAVVLDPARIHGFATEQGGATSHASIMARARGIPAVVGVKGLGASVREGDVVAVDGFLGKVLVNPGTAVRERLEERRRAFAKLQRQHARLVALPAETLDGHRVKLSANMEMPAEIDFIRERGAEGIGLFRTEFFFMYKHRAPTEEEQYEIYREALEGTAPHGAVIRALDVGGDKIASYMNVIRERNPFLGMRGIRYLVAHPDVFRTQLRAILRAGVHGHAQILFPMVSSVGEFRYAKKLVRGAMASLRRRKAAFDESPELGVMVEVPSAVMMADELAREADFLSVGSNDLIQYLLAIDRDNEALLELYQPNHPAMLRALKLTVDAAHRHGRWVSICGEMAGDPQSVPLLIGLGFDRLSVSPYLIPEVKQTVRSLRYEDCRRLAGDALACRGPREVTALIEERLGSGFSDLLVLIREADGKPPAGAASGRARRTKP